MTYSVLEMMKLAENEEGEKKKSFKLRHPRGMGIIAGAVPGALLGKYVGRKLAPDVIRRTWSLRPSEVRRDLEQGGLLLGGLAGGLAGRALAKRHYAKKREEKTASVLDAVIIGPEKVAEQEQEQDRRSWLSRNKKKLLIGLGGTAALGAGAYGLSRTEFGRNLSNTAREKGSVLLTKTKDLGIAGREKGKALITKIRNFGTQS